MVRFHKIERRVVGILLLMIAFFTVIDVISDLREGGSWLHVVPEILVIIGGCMASTIILSRWFESKSARFQEIETRMQDMASESLKTRQQLNNLKRGVADAMAQQFETWRLSPSEADVALLLLKGLSLKEIAGIRSCSLSTIRHHASVIYQKSGLDGRAQLSSYFFEDLLSSEDLSTIDQKMRERSDSYD